MADLWKDGDVITAKKLNRIIFANMTVVTSNNITTFTLDITPNDVFDENNMPTSLIIIQMADGDNIINHVTDSAIGYYQGEYLIGITLPTGERIGFTSRSRSKYFMFTKNEVPIV